MKFHFYNGLVSFKYFQVTLLLTTLVYHAKKLQEYCATPIRNKNNVVERSRTLRSSNPLDVTNSAWRATTLVTLRMIQQAKATMKALGLRVK